jgi:D-hydroxyproline dehydrogenase
VGTVAVVGAGVIGSAVAYALARDGHDVVLLDRREPGLGGASFGNAGHIATELIQPLPSPELLFGFWRELMAFNGPLDIPMSRLPALLPWLLRFAGAAFRRTKNTTYLAPLVNDARLTMARWLNEIGRSDLLKCNGHYEVWTRADAHKVAEEKAGAAERLGLRAFPASPEINETFTRTARLSSKDGAAALWFPDTGHVLDPLEVVRAFSDAAVSRGARFEKAHVGSINVGGSQLSLTARSAESGVVQDLRVSAVVICTGAWAHELLRPLQVGIPMQSARGYHVEMPGHAALVDTPVLYMDQRVLMTPMKGRLRASTFMEFVPMGAPPDERKPRLLRGKLRSLGYDCPLEGSSWVGPRPVLPDYLPGIGRVPGAADVYYAVGHQHIGLTLSAVTGDLVSDLVAGRAPRHDLAPLDLRRFRNG